MAAATVKLVVVRKSIFFVFVRNQADGGPGLVSVCQSVLIGMKCKSSKLRQMVHFEVRVGLVLGGLGHYSGNVSF